MRTRYATIGRVSNLQFYMIIQSNPMDLNSILALGELINITSAPCIFRREILVIFAGFAYSRFFVLQMPEVRKRNFTEVGKQFQQVASDSSCKRQRVGNEDEFAWRRTLSASEEQLVFCKSCKDIPFTTLAVSEQQKIKYISIPLQDAIGDVQSAETAEVMVNNTYFLTYLEKFWRDHAKEVGPDFFRDASLKLGEILVYNAESKIYFGCKDKEEGEIMGQVLVHFPAEFQEGKLMVWQCLDGLTPKNKVETFNNKEVNVMLVRRKCKYEFQSKAASPGVVLVLNVVPEFSTTLRHHLSNDICPFDIVKDDAAALFDAMKHYRSVGQCKHLRIWELISARTENSAYFTFCIELLFQSQEFVDVSQLLVDFSDKNGLKLMQELLREADKSQLAIQILTIWIERRVGCGKPLDFLVSDFLETVHNAEAEDRERFLRCLFMISGQSGHRFILKHEEDDYPAQFRNLPELFQCSDRMKRIEALLKHHVTDFECMVKLLKSGTSMRFAGDPDMFNEDMIVDHAVDLVRDPIQSLRLIRNIDLNVVERIVSEILELADKENFMEFLAVLIEKTDAFGPGYEAEVENFMECHVEYLDNSEFHQIIDYLKFYANIPKTGWFDFIFHDEYFLYSIGESLGLDDPPLVMSRVLELSEIFSSSANFSKVFKNITDEFSVENKKLWDTVIITWSLKECGKVINDYFHGGQVELRSDSLFNRFARMCKFADLCASGDSCAFADSCAPLWGAELFVGIIFGSLSADSISLTFSECVTRYAKFCEIFGTLMISDHRRLILGKLINMMPRSEVSASDAKKLFLTVY